MLAIEYVSHVNLSRALRWHPAGLNSWSLSDWTVALAGECGELANVVKNSTVFAMGCSKTV